MLVSSQDREKCECGWLQLVAAYPDSPVKFDPQMNEFSIVKGKLSIPIHHCPSCGCKAPESLRSTFFAHVPFDENERLVLLGTGVGSFAQIVQKLGPPDRDNPVGFGIGMPEPDGQITQFSSYRVLAYTKLSQVADLQFHLHADSTLARIYVTAKYIGNVA
jgi:hypothetical protein